jgi:hypothetical protein
MTATTAPALATELQLAPQSLHSVPDASQVRFTCREGALWITLDNDPRDIVLEAGEAFTTDQARRALVYALQASTLYVEPSGRSGELPPANRVRYSRKATMETFTRFHAMPFTKAAR